MKFIIYFYFDTCSFDAKSQLNEPGGIDYLDANTLVVADTNNHAIKFLSWETGEIKNVQLYYEEKDRE